MAAPLQEELIMLARNISWRYQLDLFEKATLGNILTAVRQAEREIMNELHLRAQGKYGLGLTQWSEERSLSLLDELSDLSLGIRSHLTESIAGIAGEAGAASYLTHNNIVSWDGLVQNFNAVALSAGQVRQLALETPIGGRLLEGWVDKTFDDTMIGGIRHEILTGMLKGDSYPALIDRLENIAWPATRHEATTLVRTYVQSANTGAQMAVYRANPDIVKGWRWVAALEIGGKKRGGTCMECACLDGREFALNEAHVPPCPLHPRCRCLPIPITLSWKELGFDVKEMDDVYRPWTQSDLDIHEGRPGVTTMGFHQGRFAELFEKLPDEMQLAVVGPGRLGLIKEGIVSFDDLIDDLGNVRLLERSAEGKIIGLKPPSIIGGGPGGGGIGGGGGLPLPGGLTLDDITSSLYNDLSTAELTDQFNQIIASQGATSADGLWASRFLAEGIDYKTWYDAPPEIKRLWLTYRGSKLRDLLGEYSIWDRMDTGIRGMAANTTKKMKAAFQDIVGDKKALLKKKFKEEIISIDDIKASGKSRMYKTYYEGLTKRAATDIDGSFFVVRFEGKLYGGPGLGFDAEKLATWRYLGFREMRAKVIDLDELLLTAPKRLKLKTWDDIVKYGDTYLTKIGVDVTKLKELDAADALMIKEKMTEYTLPKGETLKFRKKIVLKNWEKSAEALIRKELDDIERMLGGKIPDSLRQIVMEKGVRAYASEFAGKIVLDKYDIGGVLWHEMGHHIEFSTKGLYGQSAKYRAARATSTETEKLSKITGNRSYKADEVAYPSTFRSAYTAKVYNGNYSEVISMGFQEFYTTSGIRFFALEDQEFFRWMIGVIRGIRDGASFSIF